MALGSRVRVDYFGRHEPPKEAPVIAPEPYVEVRNQGEHDIARTALDDFDV